MNAPQTFSGAPVESGVDAHAITTGISLQEMRPRMLKRDDTFAVLDRNGDALPVPGGPEGLYHRDTRHLSRLELRLSGTKPLLLSSAVSDDGAMLTCDLTNPDVAGGGRARVSSLRSRARPKPRRFCDSTGSPSDSWWTCSAWTG